MNYNAWDAAGFRSYGSRRASADDEGLRNVALAIARPPAEPAVLLAIDIAFVRLDPAGYFVAVKAVSCEILERDAQVPARRPEGVFPKCAKRASNRGVVVAHTEARYSRARSSLAAVRDASPTVPPLGGLVFASHRRFPETAGED
jgi:hypothetical protein